MTKLEKWVASEIKTKLYDYEGREVYLGDLAYKLFESENVTGSYYCNAYKSRQWIKKYYEDIGEFINDYDDYLFSNPFTDEEKFQLQVILEVANTLINKCYSTLEDTLILDKKHIRKIVRCIKQ